MVAPHSRPAVSPIASPSSMLLAACSPLPGRPRRCRRRRSPRPAIAAASGALPAAASAGPARRTPARCEHRHVRGRGVAGPAPRTQEFHGEQQATASPAARHRSACVRLAPHHDAQHQRGESRAQADLHDGRHVGRHQRWRSAGSPAQAQQQHGSRGQRVQRTARGGRHGSSAGTSAARPKRRPICMMGATSAATSDGDLLEAPHRQQQQDPWPARPADARGEGAVTSSRIAVQGQADLLRRSHSARLAYRTVKRRHAPGTWTAGGRLHSARPGRRSRRRRSSTRAAPAAVPARAVPGARCEVPQVRLWNTSRTGRACPADSGRRCRRSVRSGPWSQRGRRGEGRDATIWQQAARRAPRGPGARARAASRRGARGIPLLRRSRSARLSASVFSARTAPGQLQHAVSCTRACRPAVATARSASSDNGCGRSGRG